MIAEDLKDRVDQLNDSERHELSAYLTKLELDNDPEYWKTIRERTNSSSTSQFVSTDEL